MKNRPLPPRPRPYNRTARTIAKAPPRRAVPDEWELIELDEPGVVIEQSEIRARADLFSLAPMAEWQDLDLPLPPVRPRY